jgi:hypothetical protein
MSAIAEFYSRNLATEIMKGTTQKAKKGAPPVRGTDRYVNTREWLDGHEDAILGTLDLALQLTDNIQTAYIDADPTFQRIKIDAEDTSGQELQPVFAQIAQLARSHTARASKNRTPAENAGGSDEALLVDLTGTLSSPSLREELVRLARISRKTAMVALVRLPPLPARWREPLWPRSTTSSSKQ